MSDEYKEIDLYGRKLRYYNEEHMEMEHNEQPGNWKRKKMYVAKIGKHMSFRIKCENISKTILIHRIVFYTHNPKWNIRDVSKDNFIDHIDENPRNNKIENLRCITHQENQWNRSKIKGYHWCKRTKKYHARIKVDYKQIHLGYFDNEEDARKAYLAGKAIYHIIRPKTVFV